MKRHIFFFFTVLFILVLAGCASISSSTSPISRELTAAHTKTPKQLYKFFATNNPQGKKGALKKKVLRLAELYVLEGEKEGINSDCAWVQMCLETGFLTFGNLVTEDMNNFCGLGAIDAEHRGERFATEELGVRAHIQHLHAYATTEEVPLNGVLIDNRYKWVQPRGKAKTVFELSKTWASDPDYGKKLDALLSKLERF